MAVDGGGADGGQGGGPQVPGDQRDESDQGADAGTRYEADYRKALTDAIAIALDQRSELERVIASGIQLQIELYDRAFSRTSEVVTARLSKDVAPAGRQAQHDARQDRASADVIPPGLVGKLVAADAHDYRKSQHPPHRAEAALRMAETARISAAYRMALAEKAPDVFDAVRTAMVSADRPGGIHATPAATSEAAVPQDAKMGNASRDPATARDRAAPVGAGAHRAQDAGAPGGQLTLNGIEPVIQQKRGQRHAQTGEGRPAPESAEAAQPRTVSAQARNGNQVVSDEVFTATRDEAKPVLPVEVEERYLRVGSRFYHPRNTDVVAFEDRGNRLETRSNSGQIAGTMVAIARARGWDEIRVTGSETFRREAWLEAAAHGMQVKGYTPSEVDRAMLAKRSRHIGENRVEPQSAGRGADNRSGGPAQSVRAGSVRTEETMNADKAGKTAGADQAGDMQPAAGDRQRARAFTEKSAADALGEYPELAGAYAAMASMRKRTADDALSPRQRAVVMARVEANLVASIGRGELPEVKMREQVETRREHTENRELKR